MSLLLPADAVVTSEPAEAAVGPWDASPAEEEPMTFRVRVEAPGGPKDIRFLHVLQGADAGVRPDSVALVQSSGGSPFAGVQVNRILVFFPVTLDTPFSSLTYTAPAGTEKHLITGLTPNSGCDVETHIVGEAVRVTIRPGTEYYADSGGVLVLLTEAITAVPTPSGIEPLPAGFRLYGNYPNPFNPVTVISYDLPEAHNVVLTIYTIMGAEGSHLGIRSPETRSLQNHLGWHGLGQWDLLLPAGSGDVCGDKEDGARKVISAA